MILYIPITVIKEGPSISVVCEKIDAYGSGVHVCTQAELSHSQSNFKMFVAVLEGIEYVCTRQK